MHMYNDGWFWGMHMFWWMFWIIGLVAYFSAVSPVPRKKLRETPLQLLQKRYVGQEISTVQYDELKSRLERDTAPGKS